MNSLIWILRKPGSRRARALEILLPTKERIHLRHRKEDPRGWRETIAGILNRQSAGFEGGEGPDGKEHASVYSLQGEHGDYTGFLRDWRKCGKRTGTLQRCWEHVERIRHRGRPDGGRKRYRYLRRGPFGTTSFILVRRGGRRRMMLFEKQAIRSGDPNLNDKKPKHRLRKRRNRPAPWARGRAQRTKTRRARCGAAERP